jgi:membrane protein
VDRLCWKLVPYLLRRSVLAAFDDGCFTIAKGAAYSALLSFFPVLTTAATVLVQTRAQFVSNTLERFLAEAVPPGTQDLVLRQFQVKGERPLVLLIVAGMVSLWAASSVIKSLMDGFQAAYRVPRSRSFLNQTGVAVSLVILSAIPLLGASLLVLFGGQVERKVMQWLELDPLLHPLSWVWEWLTSAMRYLLALVTTTLVTSTLYYYGPYRKQSWVAIWPGAILATVLWLLATIGFGWYVRNMAHYNVLYGSVGTSIALLVWMYLIAAIALVGCEFNAEWERLGRTGGAPAIETP